MVELEKSSVVGHCLSVPWHRSVQLSNLDVQLCGVWSRLAVASGTYWAMSTILVAVVSGASWVTLELLVTVGES